MKKLMITGILVGLLGAGLVYGVGTKGENGHEMGGGKEGFGRGMFSELNLTEDQQMKIREIKDRHMEEMGTVYTKADREKLMEKEHNEIKKLLTNDQKTKFEEKIAEMNERRAAFEKELNLTTDQQSKLDSIKEKQHKEMDKIRNQKLTEDEMRTKMTELMNNSREEMKGILSDEQNALMNSKFKGHGHEGGKGGFHNGPEGRHQGGEMGFVGQNGGRGMFNELNLTTDQQSQMQAIKEKYRNDIQNATTKEARDKVIEKEKAEIDKILTAEQKTKLEEQKNQMGQRGEMGFDGNHGGKGMFEDLNLTEDQQSKMSKIRENEKTEMNKIRNQKLTADERRSEMDKIRNNAKSEMKKILTNEQYLKIESGFGNKMHTDMMM